MAIKMRTNEDPECVCCECGEKRNKVLNMFDLCIANNVFTLCDLCNDKLLYKCLSADVMKSERLKSPRDIAIIQKRNKAKGLS